MATSSYDASSRPSKSNMSNMNPALSLVITCINNNSKWNTISSAVTSYCINIIFSVPSVNVQSYRQLKVLPYIRTETTQQNQTHTWTARRSQIHEVDARHTIITIPGVYLIKHLLLLPCFYVEVRTVVVFLFSLLWGRRWHYTPYPTLVYRYISYLDNPWHWRASVAKSSKEYSISWSCST